MPLQATSGAASYDAFGGGVAAVPNYIESVFSTWLYSGTDATQTITNGVDLSTNGGLVWFKFRSGSYGAANHQLYDSARGVQKKLATNTSGAEQTEATGLTSFNTNGFTFGGDGNINGSGQNFVSWTFRKAPKFFDVVTYTGDGIAGKTVAHNLGSVPGCIIVKRTDGAAFWGVYHRGVNGGTNPQQYYLKLDGTDAQIGPNSALWNSTSPTSTEFTLGTASGVNFDGGQYVAYLFAHNAGGFGLSGTDNVISCGSSVGGGSAGDVTVNLGYEPQWVLLKNITTTNAALGPWILIDNMRGYFAPTTGENYLRANAANAEATGGFWTGHPTATGFTHYANAGETYIYIAIRRGPMKVPTSGTSVFKPLGNAPASTTSGVGFPADMSLAKSFSVSQDWLISPRLTSAMLYTNSTAAENGIYGTAGPQPFDTQDGFKLTTIGTSSYAYWAFRRAPGFFDVVCYTGTGGSNTLTHNLAAAPELVIIKSRNNALSWQVGSGFTASNFVYNTLESTDAGATFTYAAGVVFSAQPTASSVFLNSSGGSNGSGATYVAYLFASCPGVSKVFNYTGNGSSQTINCGFTGGARFVMIKRTDSTGDWYVWDTARGIVANNDPHLSLNTTAAEVTTNDTIDTNSTGFIVNQVSATNVNVSSATYIGLAIA